MKPRIVIDAFWEKVEKRSDGCWEWSGARSDGYGHIRIRGRLVLAHRLAYEMFVGPVPIGKELDHKCRNTYCVNPDHLEPVTHAENLRRGINFRKENGTYIASMSKRVNCPKGHPYNEENTGHLANGNRYCLTCNRERNRLRRSRS